MAPGVCALVVRGAEDEADREMQSEDSAMGEHMVEAAICIIARCFCIDGQEE